jgi:membrane protein YqaA with SNARE-associated domain
MPSKAEAVAEPSLLTPAHKRRIRKQAEVEVDLAERRLRRRLAGGGIALILLWIYLAFGSPLQSAIAQVPVLSNILTFFYTEGTAMSAVGLFFVIFCDTLFFVIFAGELYFFWALAHGLNPVAALAAASTAGVLGQIANYWMGRYARKKGKKRPRGAKLIAFAEKANGRGGTPFLALAMATPSPEIIGFAYGLGRYPALRFAQVAAVFRTAKWVLLFLAFVYLRQYLHIFGI